LSISRKENSCTSILPRFPRTNSRQASSKFSGLTISSKVLSNLILIKFYVIERPPPHRFYLLPLLEKLKGAYLLWFQYYQILPKTHRYTLGARIDTLFIEVIEATATASFLAQAEKLPFVRMAIRKIDTIKVLLLVLWETRSLDNKKYIALSEKLVETGKMLGGWSGQLKKNSPNAKLEEK